MPNLPKICYTPQGAALPFGLFPSSRNSHPTSGVTLPYPRQALGKGWSQQQ